MTQNATPKIITAEADVRIGDFITYYRLDSPQEFRTGYAEAPHENFHRAHDFKFRVGAYGFPHTENVFVSAVRRPSEVPTIPGIYRVAHDSNSRLVIIAEEGPRWWYANGEVFDDIIHPGIMGRLTDWQLLLRADSYGNPE